VRLNGEGEDDDEGTQPVLADTLSDGPPNEQWKSRRGRRDADDPLISRYVLTTTGRVVMNRTIIDAVTTR